MKKLHSADSPRRSRRSAKAAAAAQSREMLYEQLEERVLFDAVPNGPVDPNAEEVGNLDQANVERFDTSVYAEDVKTVSDARLFSQDDTGSVAEVSRELVIVDTSVEDYQQLVDDILGEDDPNRDIEVVTIDGTLDGIEQISGILAAYSDLDALHIVSHGSDAGVNLGDVWLTRDNLGGYAAEIAQWGNALSASGDLLILGCDLASSSDGRELLESISTLTGADVAASDDDTGYAPRGGDWDLEYVIGAMETSIAFSDNVQENWQHLLAPGPTVTLNVPASAYIGDTINFTATFDNIGVAPADAGYGPFIDLIFPVNGADGAAGTDTADGIDFLGASYLGSALTTIELVFPDDDGGGVGTTGTVDHPYAVDNTGAPLQVTGTAGDKLVVIQLPFGSFVPGQPTPTIDIQAQLSTLADPYDAGNALSELDIRARAGFQFGNDELDNPASDPSVVSDTQTDSRNWAVSAQVRPTLLDMDKLYSGPENETATGPNFVRSYTIRAFLAQGQTLTDLTITDFLPNTYEYVPGSLVVTNGASTLTAADYTILDEPVSPNAQNTPNNDLVVRIDQVVTGAGPGAAAATLTFDFFVPLNDADGTPVNDPANGDDHFVFNDASIAGDWLPTDTRDQPAVTVTSNVTTQDHQLEQQSIAIQKGVSIGNDTGTAGVTPGDELEYTINFQVSDFFAFNSVIITDTFSDGQDWFSDSPGDTTEVMIPTLQFTEHGVTIPVGAFSSSNYTVTENADGTTTVVFDVSQELIDRAGGDSTAGELLGGWIAQGGTGAGQPDGSFDAGATTGQIVFRTEVLEDYKDPGTADDSVDQGDTLTNSVVIDGRLLNVNDLSARTTREADDSGASVTIATGQLTKYIYAINGYTNWQPIFDPDGDGTPEVESGNLITYRIEYDLPTSDVEGFELVDFLPLPVFDSSGLNPTRGATSDFAPGENQWHLHTSDTFTEFFEANATPADSFGGDPAVNIVTDSATNSFSIQYGTVDDPISQRRKIDILFTVPITAQPAADGLYYTNQAQSIENNTFGGSTVNQVISMQDVLVYNPDLNITKGVVSTSLNETQVIEAVDVPASAFFTLTFDGETTNAIAIMADSSTIQAELEALTKIGTGNVSVSGGPMMLPGGIIGTPFSVNFVDALGGKNVSQLVADAPNIQVTTVREPIFDSATTPAGVSFAAPGSSGPAFTGQIDSTGIAANPINSNITGVDAGDLLKFAITIENTGNADAYDLTIADLLPPGFIIPTNATGLNLQIVDGDGNALTFSGNDTDLFSGGISVNDPIQVFLSSDNTDELTFMASRDNFDPATNETTIGGHGVNDIEAMARDPFTGTLYGANADNIGTINLTTGSYTQIGSGFGTASGDNGNVTLSDVDGLAFNQQTGELYGVHDNGSYNVIFKIDLNSASATYGSFVPGAFGGDDYIVLNIAARLDDIAITRDGQIYGTDATNLYEINLDEAAGTGALSLVGGHGSNISGLVGLSVDQDGRLWGTTGNTATNGTENSLWEIDRNTGVAFDQRQLDNGADYEALESYAPGSVGSVGDFSNAQTAGDGSNIIVITYDLQLDTSVQPDTLYTNNATLSNYSSQDAGVNYADGSEQDSATATVTQVSASKSVVTTSEAHTAGTDVAIGEIVRYRLQMQIPEGTSPNLQLRDRLPNGMTFLDDGTATVAFVTNAGTAGSMSSSTISGAGLNIVGDESTVNSITPTYILPDSAVSSSATADNDTYNNGTDVYFKLGDVVTSENDDNTEYVIVEFNAIINNDQGSTTNDAGENRNNRFDVNIDGTTEVTSANVGVKIHEPSITNLTKVADVASGDAGDVATFTISYSNANGGNTTNAFESRVLDTLPSDYTLNVGSVNVTLGGGAAGIANNSAGNTVDVTIGDVPTGGTVQITYTATLNTSVEPGSMATNTASLTYTSLPGANGTTGNSTGSDTPGIPGSSLGERDGSGAPNDYTDVSSADVTITSPSISKRLVSTEIVTPENGNAQAVIGEFATYEVTLTLPEGTTNLATIVDTLDAGLAFVDMHPTIPPVLSPGLALSAGGSTTPAITSSGGTITWDLGTITNSDTNNATTETITLTYQVVVQEEAANVSGQTRDNSAAFSWEHGTLTPVDAEDITIIEPELTVTKTVALDTDGDLAYDDGKSGDAGDGIQYTITLTNASGVDAFDIDFTDVLPTVSSGSSAILAPTFTVTDTATAGAVTAADFELVGSDATGWTLQKVGAVNIDLLASQNNVDGADRLITFTIQGTIASSVAPNQAVDNTATSTWTSLDGDFSSPRSIHSTNSAERDGTDYTDSDADTLTINPPVFTKHLFATNQTETNGTNVTIGETVTYALVVSLPEGTSPDATIVDQLPPGLNYSNFQIVTTAAGSVDYLGNPLLFGDFNGTITAGDPSVSGGVADGDDVTFTFGTLDVAVDNDATNNAFLILVEAVVSDVASNTGDVDNQQILANTATIDFSFDSEPPQSSNTVSTTVVEPSLKIIKELGPTVDVDEADSGDTVTVNLTVDNTAGTSAAYDVVIDDILAAANYDLSTVNLGSSGSQYPADFTASFNSGTGLLQYSGGMIAAGETVTFSFTVELAETVTPGVTITNTATITDATTLDGVEAGERNAPDPEGDGSDTDDDTVRIRRNSIAGNVWDDANNDGVFDGSESGIGGVDIRVQGTDHHGNGVDITIQTQPNGSYLFDNLRPGTYSITQDPNGNSIPVGYLDGQDNIGTQGGIDSVNDLFFNIALPTGTETHGTGNNFGEIQDASLAGAVYHDADNDGVFDGTETGIDGVQIRLTGTNDLGNTVDITVFTAGGGLYSFAGLRPSNAAGYTITELAGPAGYLDGRDTDGSLANGDDSTVNNEISSINIVPGNDGVSYNFGEVIASTLSGYVYHDSDNDGVRTDEPATNGIQNSQIRLTGTDDLGNTVDVTVPTDINGYYEFTNLRPSNATGYTITQLSVPVAYIDGIDTLGTPGGSDTVDNVFSGVVVNSDTTGTENNFGELIPASLSGTVFNDHDNDGTFEPGSGETGIEGVAIRLTGTDDLGNAVDITINTDANGDYSFANLRPSDTAGFTLTETHPVAYTDGTDSDGSLANGDTTADDVISSINISSGDTGSDYDFGEVGTSISGTVFVDDNRDGDLDGGEAVRVGGVTIQLFDMSSGSPVLVVTVVTGVDGTYSFRHLPAGDYRIVETQPTQYGNTSPNMINLTLPLTGSTDNDFGEALYDIGDTLYFDANNNGTQDFGEEGLAGVNVTLQHAGLDGVFGNGDDPAPVTVTTDPNGNYLFTEQFVGNYTVTIAQLDLPVGMTGTEEADDVMFGAPSIDGVSNIEITTADRLDVDFGYAGSLRIGDTFWYDVDRDGTRNQVDSDGDGTPDTLEPGLAGVTVNLTFAGADGNFTTVDDNLTLSTATAADGTYGFNNLPEGDYQISYVVAGIPSGLTAAVETDDSSAAVDGTANISLSADRTDVDFGFVGDFQLGDIVWFDFDGNGTRGQYDSDGDTVADTDEPTFAGVDVTIVWAGFDGNINTTADNVVFTDTTDANGVYGVSGLLDGTYRVSVDLADLPAAMTHTFEVDATTNNSADVVISGNDRLDVDFGFNDNASISDQLWYDVNNDGVFNQYDNDGDSIPDTDEPGLAGITVTAVFGGANGIIGDADDFTLTTVTAADGTYSFNNLPQGNYEIIVDTGDLPTGFTNTFDKDDYGGTSGDSRANVALADGENDNAVDYGYAGNHSVGDVIWFDRNGDGVQDNLNTATGEPGLGGITVTLTFAGADGNFATTGDNVMLTTTTAADGSYSFDNLLDGEYRIVVMTGGLPTGMTQTFETDGTGLGNLNDQSDFSISGGDRTDIDFGYTGALSVGDRLWYDADADGNQDAAEPGISRVDIVLTFAGADDLFGNADDFTVQTTTDAGGLYNFDNLPTGDYRISVTTASLPTGMINATAESDDTAPAIDGTANINLTANRTDVDFGFAGNRTVGDFVWFDRDGDGTRNQYDSEGDNVPDTFEPGYGDVDVTLLFAGQDGIFGNSDDVSIQTTTDAAGNYNFTDLPNGDFRISVDTSDLPAGINQTFEVDGTTNNQAHVTIAGSDLDTVDFSFRGTGSISDRVWHDVNGDGGQEAGEPGLVGVPVNLAFAGEDGVFGTTDDFSLTTTTGANGLYSFDHLPAGRYRVDVDEATVPGSHNQTFEGEDVGGTIPGVAEVSLTNGQVRTDVDFGYEGTLSLGDRIWFDANNNGVQDAGEPGLEDIGVRLIFAGPDGGFLIGSDNVTLNTTTDANGLFTFDRLFDGNYQVIVTTADLPGGAIQTNDQDDAAFGASALDHTANIALSAAIRDDADFGYRGNSSIGDLIFFDVNNDGTLDAGDRGLPNIDVTAEVDINGDGNPEYTNTVTTDINGSYLFENLIAGTYTVTVDDTDLPPGMAANQTADPDGTLDHTTDVVLGANEENDAIDFGYNSVATIGDRVWLDTNGDGIQDAINEPGLGTVDVTLTWAGADNTFGNADDEIFLTTTDNDGNYLFEFLSGGEYRVDVDQADAPGNTSLTTGNDGIQITLPTGGSNDTIVFGFVGGATGGPGAGVIGDRIFFDHNGDGIENGDDVGYPGIDVTITADINGDGQLETFVATTDSTGFYSVPGLPYGDYTVTLTPPNGTDPSFDSDGIATPNTSNVTLNPTNSGSDTQDFGLTGTGSVGDTIFFDENGDGVQNPGEVGIPGVTLTIDVDLDGDGNPDFTTNAVTDQNGNYTFANIPEGQVTVSITTPIGSNPTTDHDGTTVGDNSNTINLTAGETNDAQDFGFLGTGSIGDVVFFDTDGDRSQDDGSGTDPSEPGLSGVTVELDIDFNGDGTVDHTISTTTGANGGYSFDNLPAGDYTVRVTQPVGTTQTFDATGGLDNQSLLTLGDGENNTAQDFGYRGNGSIGDVILFDVNNDGIQNANDRGLPGVDVTLEIDVNGDGTPDYTHTVTTDIDGNYQFANLIPGDYTITVDMATLPTGMENFPTIDPDGTGTLHTADITLGVEETKNDQDFAYYANSGIGDVVWLDLNGDGVQDASEPGIGNIDVILMWYGRDDTLGTPDDEVFTQTTNISGGYFFPGRPEGLYRVEVDPSTLPLGVSLTTGNNPGDFFLPDSTSDLERDFGFVGVGSIGDQVFYDLSGDGSVDALTETGYPGVTVTITGDFDNDGIVESFQTVTDTNGNYNVSGLPLGDWTVTLTPPAGTAPTFDADGTTTPNTSEVTLTAGPGATNDAQYFGLTGTGQVVGDTIFFDEDGDGLHDPGESGIPGLTVQIDIDLDGDGTPDISTTTTTDQDGNYVFPNIPAGTHTISVVPPVGSNPTSDLDGDTTPDISGDVAVPPGGNGGPGGMGFLGTGSIGNTVFFDADSNGVQGLGEPGMPNVPVDMQIDFNGDGMIDHIVTVTTDDNGNYNFPNLMSVNYNVVVTQPAGTNPTSDADGHTTSPDVSSLALTPGENNTVQNFGYIGTGSITDTVFFDIVNDATDDTPTDDRVLENVDVTLSIDLNGDGTPDYVTTVPTDPNGDFTFANLIPGTYTITTDPSDMPLGLADNPTVDNDGTGTPHSADYVLPPGANVDGPGFGFHATPDYEITKTSNVSSVQPGDTIQYTIRVRNTGELDGRNVTITDNFPVNVLSVSSASGGVVDNTNGVITWDLAAMQPGEEVILLVTADVFDPAASGNHDITNTVSVTDDGFNGTDPTPTNNTSAVTTPFDATPDYVVTVTDDLDEVDPGDSISYTITVTNDGNQDGTGVVVTSQLKPELMANVTPNAGGVYDPATGIVIWNLGNLDAGETVILTIDGTVVNPLPFGYDHTCNTVSASDDGTNGPDPTPGNNVATDTTALPVFAFDSFNDLSGGGGDSERYNTLDVLPTGDDPYKNRVRPLPVDTIYTGIVDPGTTLSGKIYDQHGRMIGEQIVMADTAGNWLMQFPTVVLYEQPHEMRIEQTHAVQNSGQNAGFNMRRFFHPAVHSQLYMNEPISVGAAFRHDPFSVLTAMHEANNNPLGFGWEHHAYELVVSSSNSSAM